MKIIDNNIKIQDSLNMIGININQLQTKQLIDYIRLIQKWNQTFNLTSITDFDKILHLHIVDSASVLKFIKGNLILDVGTGAGLPGIVLAILSPNKQFFLLDSNNKKVRFLRQCQLELSLENIKPVHTRVENFQSHHRFDSIICRAFASLEDFINKSKQHLTTNGYLLLMKAKWNKEKYNIKQKVYPISLNGLERHLIEIKQIDL